jgi:hypothetical protein
MRATLTRVTLVLILIVSALPAAHAQFDRWPGFVKNIEVGYGISKTWADYVRKDRVVREDGKLYDTSVSTSVSSSAGLSYQFGTSIPLKRLGEKSMLHLGIVGVYNAYTWDYPTASTAYLTDSGIRYDYTDAIPFTGITLNYGAAISADFKFGVDAMMDKYYRWGWTGGIGVLPSASLTADFDNADLTFGVQPFVKTELSLRAGIVWKLRLLYAMGKLDYIDAADKNGFFGFSGSENQTQLTGKGNFTVSLTVLPFSFTYRKSDWYNSY